MEARKGRPRIEERSKSFEATKPWIALGMSRTTWYRRRKEKATQPPEIAFYTEYAEISEKAWNSLGRRKKKEQGK